jgi:hypothetical protein
MFSSQFTSPALHKSFNLLFKSLLALSIFAFVEVVIFVTNLTTINATIRIIATIIKDSIEIDAFIFFYFCGY